MHTHGAQQQYNEQRQTRQNLAIKKKKTESEREREEEREWIKNSIRSKVLYVLTNRVRTTSFKTGISIHGSYNYSRQYTYSNRLNA